jgi:hypothetical protein
VADVDRLKDFITSKLDVANLVWPEEFSYPHLSMCVMDAIFSINTRYEAVINVIARYCDYYKIPRPKGTKGEFLPTEDQDGISKFVARVEAIGSERMAGEVLKNRQCTSTRSGILKAEAAYRVALILKEHGAEYLQDVAAIQENEDFEREFRLIPGQGSGVSLSYFWMLAGDQNLIKPDRMVIGFLSDALGRTNILTAEATDLVVHAAHDLKVPPALLDYAIWSFQRQ